MQLYKPKPIIIRVWENDFGLPSVDPECLQLMLICKLALTNVKFKKANLPFYRPIPSIQFSNRVITKLEDMLIELQLLCQGAPDCFLEKEALGRIVVFKKYFIHKFVPAFFYDCWINPINYEHTIKTWYVNAMLYPLGYLYANYKSIQAHERFNNMVGLRDTERMILKLYYDAQCCLNDIASILLKNKHHYILGEFPSTLDTLVYSYLAVALYLPLPETYLQNLIKEHTILVEYVNHITKCYFADIKKTFKYVEPLNATFEDANVKSVIIAGLCATTIMIAYAWSNRLLPKIPLPNIPRPSMNDINNLYFQFVIFLDKFSYPQF